MIELIKTIASYILAIGLMIVFSLVAFNLSIVLIFVLSSMFDKGKIWKTALLISLLIGLWLGIYLYEKSHPGKPWKRPDYSEIDEYDEPQKCYGANICE